MSEIYLIRHGQASFGSANYDRLSDKGVLQSDILGKHLASLNIKFDAIYYGEMDRQQKTAAGMIKAYKQADLPVPDPVVDKKFNEYDSGSVWDAQITEMLKSDPGLLDPIKENPNDNAAFQKIFSKVVNRWVSGQYDSDGDVIWSDFRDCVTGGLKELMQKEGSKKRVALFSSGGPISVAVGMAMELSDLKTVELSWQVVNASITRLKYGKDRVALTGFNDITHLEMMGDRTLLTYR